MELVSNTLTVGDLPQGAYKAVARRLRWMEEIAASPKIMAACQKIAEKEGLARGTIHRIYKTWIDSGKSWDALIDRRYMSGTWVREENVKLPAAFIGHFRLLCEENSRSMKAAHRRLLRQLEDWRIGKGEPIPGYDFPPDNQSGRDHPKGWGYNNLSKHKPTDVQRAAAHIGRSAAKQLLPSVLTTRVNMYPFAEIQFDDMWHDFQIWMKGQKESCRLLEFGAIDYFSGFIFPPGLKPRVRDMETKKMKSLNQADFRFFLAYILTQWGYHPQGTILNVENGTAAISSELQEYLRVATNGKVRVVRSGMSGRSALPGGYREAAKGNFRVKSLKEGMGSIIHAETAMLPGNVGKDRDHLPAENWGRNEEHKLNMAVVALKPHLAEKMKFGFLSLNEAREAIGAIYDRLNDRKDHKLQGFEEAGLEVEEVCISETLRHWVPLAELPSIIPNEEERNRFAMVVRGNDRLKNRRVMSPREAFETERQRLIKMPVSTLPHLLGKDAGKLKVVRQLQFHLEGEDIGGQRKFIAEFKDKLGLPVQIPNGTKCRVFINPFAPDRLIVADPESNEFLGECTEHKRVDRRDLDAIREQSGKIERIYRDAVAETGVRASRSKTERQRHNAKVIRDDCNGSERRIEGLDNSVLLAEENFDDEIPTETPTEERDPLLWTDHD